MSVTGAIVCVLGLLGVTLADPEASPGTLYLAAPEGRGQFHVNDKQSYKYGYNTGDGAAKVEVGHPDGTITGSYRYFDPNGRQIVRSYIADKKGFRVLGNDLPVSIDSPAVVNLDAQSLTAPVEGDSSSPNVHLIPPRSDILLQSSAPLRTTSSDPCSYSQCQSTTRTCSSSRSSCSSRSCSRSCSSSSPSYTPSCSSRCSTSSRRCCSSSSSVRSCCSSTRRSCCSSSSSCSSQRNCCPSPCSSSSSNYFYQRQREALDRQDRLIRQQEQQLAQLKYERNHLFQGYGENVVEESVSSGVGTNYFYASDRRNYEFPAGFILNDKVTRFRPLYVRPKQRKRDYIIGHAK